MKGLGNKLLIFSLGILIGVIVGGGIVWFVFGSSGKNIYIFNNSSKKEVIDDEDNQKTPSNKNKGDYKTSNHSEQNLEKEMDANEKAMVPITSDEMEYTQNSNSNKDTAINANVNEDSEELIVVKKDELLYSKMVPLMDLNSSMESVSRKDSMLQLSSGIKEPLASVNYMLEYWKSPINYKGYKTNKNKIVLFGMAQADKPRLFKLGEDIYLKNNEKTYKIGKSADYSAYELVTDLAVLSKLN